MLQNVKVLFVSRDLPLPNTYGMGAYVLSLVRHLRRTGCEIEYVVLGIANNAPGWIVPAELDAVCHVVVDRGIRLGPHILLSLSNPMWWLIAPLKYAYLNYLPEEIRQRYKKFKRWLRPPPSGPRPEAGKAFPPQVAPPAGPEIEFFVERYAMFEPDVIIVNHAWLAEIFRFLPGANRVVRVVLAPDIMHQRRADFEAHGLHAGFGDWDREIEQAFLSNAEVILAIQEHDAQVLRQMLPEREVICAPIAISVHQISGAVQVPGRCLFVGSYVDHNVVGLNWFLETVWPIILARDPDATLHVCGEVCKSVTGQFGQVRLLGRVENLDEEYGAAEVCLVPLHVGSGLKIKLVQALSYGRVCVSTSVGVQGLPEIGQAGVSVADTATDFADAVHALLSDSERRVSMQQQAQQYVEAMFAPEVVFTTFSNRILEHVRGQSVPSG